MFYDVYPAFSIELLVYSIVFSILASSVFIFSFLFSHSIMLLNCLYCRSIEYCNIQWTPSRKPFVPENTILLGYDGHYSLAFYTRKDLVEGQKGGGPEIGESTRDTIFAFVGLSAISATNQEYHCVDGHE